MSFATELRKAAPLGVTPSAKLMAHTFARRSGVLGPVIRTSARPCVASKTLTSPSSRTCSTRCVTVVLVPGAASRSHSPGPEPTKSVPWASRAARPKGTPQRGRHAARRYPAHDLVFLLHDLARFRGNQRAIVRLQADEPRAAFDLALPH